MKTTNRAILLIIGSSLFAGVGQILWKKASFTIDLSLVTNIYLLLGIALYLTAILLMTLSFREGELSVLHPLLATSYIWVVLISPLIFQTEFLNSYKIMGTILLFLGVVFISRSRKDG